MDAFPPEVAARLKTYVYRLIDPRNGETFYVGKGQGDRVFAHIRGEEKLEADVLDEKTVELIGKKLERIRRIRLDGFEVGHVIHRHGLDDKTAFEVEAALIEAYAGLTNELGGAGSAERGAMHAAQIVKLYCAEPAVCKQRCS